eukprot:UN09796
MLIYINNSLFIWRSHINNLRLLYLLWLLYWLYINFLLRHYRALLWFWLWFINHYNSSHFRYPFCIYLLFTI